MRGSNSEDKRTSGAHVKCADISMSTLLAEECRKCAAECAELAEKQDDPERQREYSDLATMWRLIAQNNEKTDVV
jgi:hypothetical protein